MRSTQEEGFANRCVGWDINCCKLYEEVPTSILMPSFVLLTLFHHDFELALKSRWITEKCDLKALISCSICSGGTLSI